jgi:hypothetical protein
VGQEIPSFPPFIIAKLQVAMSDETEIQSRLTNRMDEAFCDRMRAAIAVGLENAPIGVTTAPGTKSPKYVPAEPRAPISSQAEVV